MSIICVILENQISGHEHGLGMIAAQIPIAYLHESITPIQQSKLKQALLGIGGFFAFHGGLHAIAEQRGICNHEAIKQNTFFLGQGRLEQMKQLHAHSHGMDGRTRIGVFIGAIGEELYSRLPLRKLLLSK